MSEKCKSCKKCNNREIINTEKVNIANDIVVEFCARPTYHGIMYSIKINGYEIKTPGRYEGDYEYRSSGWCKEQAKNLKKHLKKIGN